MSWLFGYLKDIQLEITMCTQVTMSRKIRLIALKEKLFSIRLGNMSVINN